MPTKYYRKKKPAYKARKRLNYRRKRNYKRRTQNPSSVRSWTGFPVNKIAKLRFINSQKLSIINPTPDHYEISIRANGIFDVDGGTHRPYGAYQWSQFYNHYVVLGAKISVTFAQSAGSPGDTIACVVYLDDDTVAKTDWRQISESGRGRYRFINPGGSIGETHAVTTVRNNFSAKKYFNVVDVKDNLDRFGAAFGADPVEGAFWKIFVQTTDNSTPSQTTIFTVTYTIDYIISCSEPKELIPAP